jgi:hypothetical protein
MRVRRVVKVGRVARGRRRWRRKVRGVMLGWWSAIASIPMRTGVMIIRIALVERTSAVQRVRAVGMIGVIIEVGVRARWRLCRVPPVGIGVGLVMVITNIWIKVSWVVEGKERCSRDKVIVPVPPRIRSRRGGRVVVIRGVVCRCCCCCCCCC